MLICISSSTILFAEPTPSYCEIPTSQPPLDSTTTAEYATTATNDGVVNIALTTDTADYNTEKKEEEAKLDLITTTGLYDNAEDVKTSQPSYSSDLDITIGGIVLNTLITDVALEVPTDAYTKISTDLTSDTPANTPTDKHASVPTDAPHNVSTDEATNVPTDTPANVRTAAPASMPTDAPASVPIDTPAIVTDRPTEYLHTSANVLIQIPTFGLSNSQTTTDDLIDDHTEELTDEHLNEHNGLTDDSPRENQTESYKPTVDTTHRFSSEGDELTHAMTQKPDEEVDESVDDITDKSLSEADEPTDEPFTESPETSPTEIPVALTATSVLTGSEGLEDRRDANFEIEVIVDPGSPDTSRTDSTIINDQIFVVTGYDTPYAANTVTDDPGDAVSEPRTGDVEYTTDSITKHYTKESLPTYNPNSKTEEDPNTEHSTQHFLEGTLPSYDTNSKIQEDMVTMDALFTSHEPHYALTELMDKQSHTDLQFTTSRILAHNPDGTFHLSESTKHAGDIIHQSGSTQVPKDIDQELVSSQKPDFVFHQLASTKTPGLLKPFSENGPSVDHDSAWIIDGLSPRSDITTDKDALEIIQRSTASKSSFESTSPFGVQMQDMKPHTERNTRLDSIQSESTKYPVIFRKSGSSKAPDIFHQSGSTKNPNDIFHQSGSTPHPDDFAQHPQSTEVSLEAVQDPFEFLVDEGFLIGAVCVIAVIIVIITIGTVMWIKMKKQSHSQSQIYVGELEPIAIIRYEKK